MMITALWMLMFTYYAMQRTKQTRDQRWMDIDFLPDAEFVYPTPQIQSDPDLVGSDVSCNCNTVCPETKSQLQHITSINQQTVDCVTACGKQTLGTLVGLVYY